MKIYAVVPAKDFKGAKQRLAALLSPQERCELARAMLVDTLQACAQAASLDGYAVVTSDANVAQVATACGSDVMWEAHAGGHSQAVNFAAQVCQQRGIPTMLTLPADLPLITAPDIESIVAPPLTPVSVVLVPSRDEKGTNAVVLSPPTCLSLRFGYDSFNRHLRLAAERHLAVDIRRLPRVALDIDEADDLARCVPQLRAGNTYQLLDDIGISKRLASASMTC